MSQIIQLKLKLSNAFVIKEKKLIMVDTGSPGETSLILRKMAAMGLNIQDLALIVHTHAHTDHCGCSADLKKQLNSPIAVHRSDAQSFSNGADAPIVPISRLGRCLMPFLKGGYPAAAIDILLADEFDLSPYGVEGKIIATPGHTPGSVSVILDNGEAIAGDLIGGGRLMGMLQPARPRYHHWYSDFDVAKMSIARLMSTAPAKVFVGHGGPLEGEAAIKHFNT